MTEVHLAPIEISNRADQTRAFGLITLRGWLQCPGTEPVRVNVSANDQAASFAAGDCCVALEDNAWRILINLTTHLFENGLLRASISVEFANGETHSFPERFLAVDNSSPLARQVAEDLVAHGTPPILGRIVDSSHFPYENGQAKAWFDKIVTPEVPLSLDCAPDRETAHRHLEHWGFCILPERLSDEIINEFKAEVSNAIAAGKLSYLEGSSQRILNAHRLKWGRKIWLYPPVMEFLTEHFRDKPCACQTLTYVHGSEQNAHQDTIHLTPYPAGMMSGVWIALEDVQPNSGELFVYPGSHRTPRLRAAELGLEKVDEDYSSYKKFDDAIHQMMVDGGFERITYNARAGQILVWHENLVHGGSVRIEKDVTRFSIVSHYFAQGSVAYYDSRGEAASLEALPDFA